MLKQLVLGIAVGLPAIAIAAQAAAQPDEMQQGRGPQARRAKAPTGMVSGNVYCADTNLPARLAAIYLVQISQNSFGTRSAGVSDLEGRFALNHVKEGDYYVVPVLPGYVNLLSSLTKAHLDAMTADERRSFLAQVASVTISANEPAQLSIRLERGAEIDGTVTFDDGSPAIGARISFRLKAANERNGELPQFMSEGAIYSQTGPPMTDDRGHFRILGVPPGEYVVSASVPGESAIERADQSQIAEMMDASIGAIEVYVGGGMRASKAETIKVTSGGTSKDADITIPLSRLHTIRGQIVLKSTGQPPPAATLQLLYADTKEPARMAMAPNGEFEIHYVPEGNFILKAMASAQPLPEIPMDDDEQGSYGVGFSIGMSTDVAADTSGGAGGSGEISLAVTGDVDGVSIAVPDPRPIPHSMRSGGERQNTAPFSAPDSSQ